VKLKAVKFVRPADYATILVGRPRQGTLNRWPSAGLMIENIVEGRPTELALNNLSYAQQEILCSEFLRTSCAVSNGLPTLVGLILPVGRTMKDIDFIGIASDGKPIFAQVTFSNLEAARRKLERLRKYDDDRKCHLILFCSVEKPSQQGRIKIVPLSIVFKEFTSTKSGKTWLKYTLGHQRDCKLGSSRRDASH
jgi:hypothetical protein